MKERKKERRNEGRKGGKEKERKNEGMKVGRRGKK